MKPGRIVLGSLALVLFVLGMVAAWQQDAKKQEVKVGEYTMSGPYTHDNLTLYLIHGEDKIKGKAFLTLQEAMDQKKVVVHETGNVNQLTIENVSPDEEVYVQSGDIVKGGKQDRVIAMDFIVPPKSGQMPIASFCVEQGRWSQRRGEAQAAFSKSDNSLSTKDLKIAAKVKGQQGEVWKEVEQAQEKLGKSVGESVKSPQSGSSMQLTLESKKLEETTDQYLKALSSVIEGKENVIGYAFAVNGKLNSADVYASGALFKKLWPKLIKASAVEAIADKEKDGKFEPVAVEAVRASIEDAEKGRATEKDVTKRIRMSTRETNDNYMFETLDNDNKGLWLHRNYVKK